MVVWGQKKANARAAMVVGNEEAATCFRNGGLLYPNSRPGSGNSNPYAKDRELHIYDAPFSSESFAIRTTNAQYAWQHTARKALWRFFHARNPPEKGVL
jgi:trehalose-6-phosphate synthase